jgi:hypothetical protein
MKAAILLLLLGSTTLGQSQSTTSALTIELRATSVHLRMRDKIGLSVFFRSLKETTTIWNALWWGGATGLELQVFDSSGHPVEHTVVPSEPMPPELTGKDALISIGGRAFAGFDSEFAVTELFHHVGFYAVRCVYHPPLSRNYFKGRTIWGRQNGQFESPPLSITIEE